MDLKEAQRKIREAKLAIKRLAIDVNSEFGKNVKAARIAQKMSQRDLSSLTGVSRSQITNIELGNSGITIITLCQLCAALDVTPNDILGYNKERGK